MSHLGALVAVNVVYLAIVLVIGGAAYRKAGSSSEDYFLGGRSARTIVLFMAMFGTNITPFVLMGIPGLAYREGIGVFGLNAAIVAFGVPLSIYVIGYPAWIAARKIGAVTPAELYAERFGSPSLGLLMFLAFFVYTLPYMVTSVLGVGLAVEIFTRGEVSFEAAAAAILIITLIYTGLGGMKATMWTNVFQGAVFTGFVLVMFFVIASDLGGFAAATSAVDPSLLVETGNPRFEPGAWGSWGIVIALTVIAFPHMLVRVFAARDTTALKNTCRLYPILIILLWGPVVVMGVWGTTEIPGLEGKAADGIFPLLVQRHGGSIVQGIGLAGILAAVMSSLDAQALTLSSMLSRDVLRRYVPNIGDRREVMLGRIFLLVISIVVYVIVVLRPASIFDIATFSFSGYVMLVPTLLLALRWRRYTAAGAIASIVAGNVVLLWAFSLDQPLAGLLPVAWGLLAAVVAGVGLSLVTRPPPSARTERVLGDVDAAFAR